MKGYCKDSLLFLTANVSLTTRGLLGLTLEGTGDRQGSVRRGLETKDHKQHYENVEQPYSWEAVPKGVEQVGCHKWTV